MFKSFMTPEVKRKSRQIEIAYLVDLWAKEIAVELGMDPKRPFYGLIVKAKPDTTDEEIRQQIREQLVKYKARLEAACNDHIELIITKF